MSWYTAETRYFYGYCTHPNAIKHISYNTGNIDYRYAREMREDRRSCGKSARYYLDINELEAPKSTHVFSCTSCVHQKKNNSFSDECDQEEYALCTHPLATEHDMVSGVPIYPYTSDMRKKSKPNDIMSCGEKGFMYEEKPTKDDCQDKDDKERDTASKAFMVMVFILLILL